MSSIHDDRMIKVERLRAFGMDPWPVSVPRDTAVNRLQASKGDLDAYPADVFAGEPISITGRVVLSRNGGGICFATLQEEGTTIQIMITRNDTGQDLLTLWKKGVDLGDFVSITGILGRTSAGELTVRADSWTMASKAMLSLPSKVEGLTDPEIRRRSRHLDLIVNDDARERLRVRSLLFRTIREELWGSDFQEVDTPILQDTHGGASARPFTTRSEALSRSLSLRIAPELYLKRLLVGGLSSVFEIGPNFRNEGVDSTHSPEFQMLEAYEAYSDYFQMEHTMQNLLRAAALAALGTTVLPSGIDLGKPFARKTLVELVVEAVKENVSLDTSLPDLKAAAQRVGYHDFKAQTVGAGFVELFEELVEKTLREPTFVVDWPVEIRPLARTHRTDPRLTESWDLIIEGMEVGTAYSELVDPLDQRARLTEQSLIAAAGDPEAMELDEAFLAALSQGCPPAGGMGLGLDRVLMLLTGTRSIRDTVTFPALR